MLQELKRAFDRINAQENSPTAGMRVCSMSEDVPKMRTVLLGLRWNEVQGLTRCIAPRTVEVMAECWEKGVRIINAAP